MFPITTERAKTAVDQVGQTDWQMTYFLSSRAIQSVSCCCRGRESRKGLPFEIAGL